MTGTFSAPDRPSYGRRTPSKLLVFLTPQRRFTAAVIQVVYLVGGVLLGWAAGRANWGPEVSSTDLRGLLFAVGGGIIALVSLIYSLLFLVVQWGATTFSPRLTLFRDEAAVRHGFGFFVGVFGYCMVAGLSIGDNPTVPVAVPGLCMVMVFLSFALIR